MRAEDEPADLAKPEASLGLEARTACYLVPAYYGNLADSLAGNGECHANSVATLVQ